MSRQVAARAIRDHARTQARRAQQVYRAEVVHLDPLRVARIDNDQVLEVEDDFDLSGTLRLLVKTVPLVVGDTLMLHKESDHYAAFDVLTESTI